MNIEKKHKLILLDAKLRIVKKHEHNAGLAQAEERLTRNEDVESSILSVGPSLEGDEQCA